MAENSAKVANMARVLAIVHIIVGFLLICFGIADRVVEYFWTGDICFGIWTGSWMCIAGGLGIPGTRKERSTSRNVFALVFMGFSITSAVLGGIIIICYSIAISMYDHYRDSGYLHFDRKYRPYNTEMALTAIILILGVVAFAIGIWTSVCICLMNPFGATPQQGQVIYTTNAGYIMTQGPGGAPVAIPMQAGGGMVAVQTAIPGAQGAQSQMVTVPVSGAEGYQPQLVQVAPAGAMATGYQPQQVEIPPLYAQGQYVAQQNEQITVKI